MIFTRGLPGVIWGLHLPFFFKSAVFFRAQNSIGSVAGTKKIADPNEEPAQPEGG